MLEARNLDLESFAIQVALKPYQFAENLYEKRILHNTENKQKFKPAEMAQNYIKSSNDDSSILN